MSSPKPILNTPMLRQFQEIKEGYQDAILFFRLGDFYEMFLDDAILASKELDLTLTGRGKDDNRVPMCGVPYHAAEGYISKLVQKGYKVAICEQVEEATESKGITKRDVVQVITPGTVQHQSNLQATENNYLCACYVHPKKMLFGLSFVDISTGSFHHFQSEHFNEVKQLVDQLDPKELLIESEDATFNQSSLVETHVDFKDNDSAERLIASFFNINALSAFGLEEMKESLPSAAAIITYLKDTQKHNLPQITALKPYYLSEYVRLDKATIQNLELTHCYQTQSKKGSLFWVLDATKTALGARLLNQSLKAPLISKQTIEDRLDAVSIFKNDLLSREEVRDILNAVYDLERLVSRIVSNTENPRDLLALKQSLSSLSELHHILNACDSSALIQELRTFFSKFSQEDSVYQKLIDLIDKSIIETSKTHIKDGHIIKDGYSAELDEIKLSFKTIKDWIGSLETKEKERTGIKSLKVGFNKVFGYYIQVSNANKDDVPEDYIRKQTLTNAERYITHELKEKETILLNGEEQQYTLEQTLYREIVEIIKAEIKPLQDLSERIALLDFLQSLGTVAQKHNYARPHILDSEDQHLSFIDGRHPVLEKTSESPVIPNSISLTPDQDFILITGPNMAGKSTIMKQVALTVIMAQIGSFVPAESFKFALVDQVFTRIGAVDNLYQGQSTFMVEMLETSTILHNATSKSLILLDEVGRGTSTYDGLSIAGSVCEYIMTHINARTLFATHYHELTALEEKFSKLSNYSMAIHEENGQLAFTYILKKGPADKSYGIHVAEMAGLPKEVIANASKMLEYYEKQSENEENQLRLF